MIDKPNIWRTETRIPDRRFEAAKAAMVAILISPHTSPNALAVHVANDAVVHADALLAELAKKGASDE